MSPEMQELFASRLLRLERMREDVVERIKRINNEHGEEAHLIKMRLVGEEEALANEIDQLKGYFESNQSVIRRVVIEARGEKRQINIVSAGLVNPKLGFISNESPLGKALLAGLAGQNVSVSTPNGTRQYKIVDTN